jgi:hypothetical protein
MTFPSNQDAKPVPVQIGAYLHSAHDLYWVEALNGEYALIEDCRSGDLLDMPLRDLRHLEPVGTTGRASRRRPAIP